MGHPVPTVLIKKLYYSSAEHVSVYHDEGLGRAQKGLKAGLEGWWGKEIRGPWGHEDQL